MSRVSANVGAPRTSRPVVATASASPAIASAATPGSSRPLNTTTSPATCATTPSGNGRAVRTRCCRCPRTPSNATDTRASSPRFSTEIAYTTPGWSASDPKGANIVPRTTSEPIAPVNAGSQPNVRSQTMAFPSSCPSPLPMIGSGIPFTRITGRANAGPCPFAKSGAPAYSTAERDPRCTSPSACSAPSAGWMQGTVTQWFPVTCHATGGIVVRSPPPPTPPTPPFPCVSIVCRKITGRGTFHHSGRTDIILSIQPLRAALALAAALPPLVAHVAAAQAVSDIGDEARTLPAGVMRVDISESDTRYNLRYGTDGLRPLGSDLSVDTLGVTQLPILAPVQTALQGLLGDPTYHVTFGDMLVESSTRISTTPITLEFGVTHWLTVRATAPLVRTTNEVFFNPNANLSGNVGLNPALGFAAARDTDAALYTEFVQASATLGSDLAACQANPASASYCAGLLAQQAAVQALIAQSNGFAANLARVYGAPTALPGGVVPTQNSAAQRAIVSRIAAFAAMFAHYDSLTGGPGIPTVGPIGASPVAWNDAQTIIASGVLGLSADSIQRSTQSGIGDIDLSATFQLFDSFHGHESERLHPHGFNFRTAITGVYRLGTGTPTDPGALLGLGAGTGTGASAIGAHSATDILVGPHFWTSIVARLTTPLTDHLTMRIPLDPGNVYIPQFAEQTVTRTLGQLLDVEVDPHYTLNDYFGFTLHYRYIQKSQDRYSGTFHLDSAETGYGPVTLDAALLGLGTATTETRLGLGVTFSTVASHARGTARFPFDISYVHEQTATGSGNYVPRIGYDEVRLRVYVRLFGGAHAAAPPPATSDAPSPSSSPNPNPNPNR